MLPIAVDANGGDKAPAEIVEGARRAREELDVEIVLVGTPDVADLVGLLVWVEAESQARLARGIARDGEQMRAHWVQWRLDEEALFARLGTQARADLVVDTDT